MRADGVIHVLKCEDNTIKGSHNLSPTGKKEFTDIFLDPISVSGFPSQTEC